MGTNQYLRELLLRNFEQIKLRNSRYSMRKYAKDLELSSGALSEFFNGQRSFTTRTIIKIFSKLKISEDELLALENAFEDQNNSNNAALNLPFKLSLSEKGSSEIERLLSQFVAKIFRMSESHPGTIEVSLHISKEIKRSIFPKVKEMALVK